MTEQARTPGRGRVEWLVLSVVVVGWYLLLAPSSLGGPLTPVLTSGTSMEPTFRAGDLAIGYRADRPAIGDVVLARHPSGPLVLHRMIGQDEGGIITQGDNLDRPDPWRTRPEEVLGTVRFSIGGAWRVLAVLRSPLAMGTFAALIILALAGLRSSGPSPPRNWAPSLPAILSVAVVGSAVMVAGLGAATTASLDVTSDQLLGFVDPAPLDPVYDVHGPGGGGGGGGGNCPPAKPTC